MTKIDYTALQQNSATTPEIDTYFANYNEDTIAGTGELNFSNVAASATATQPYEIINSILVFDKDNGTDPYYTGDYQNSDWSTTLRYVTDSDLQAYAKEHGVEYSDVKSFVTEVRQADLDGRVRVGETGGNLVSKATVLSAFTQNNQTGNNLIKSYVTAFDDNDGVGVNNVTAADLNKFAQYYGLNDQQIEQLKGLYSTTAEVEKRGNKNANDSIRDKIVAK